MAYTSENDLKPEEKVSLSVKMAIAVLVSRTIYNYGELLEQDVLKSLEKTENNWLFELLKTYNSGNVSRFEKDFDTYKHQIQSNVRNSSMLFNYSSSSYIGCP